MLNPVAAIKHGPCFAIVEEGAIVEDGAIVDDGASLVARWATPEDRAYAARRRRSGASLGALAALRGLLFAATERTDWRIERAPFGKPSIVDGRGRSGPAISLSHTKGLIAVAVAAEGAIGIDVEHHRTRDFVALAEQAFGPAEQAEVAVHGAEAFYRIWTLREAMAKATGEGLALAIHRRDLAENIVTGIVHRRERSMRRWHLLHTLPRPDCGMAFAWFGGGAAPPHRVDLASACP